MTHTPWHPSSGPRTPVEEIELSDIPWDDMLNDVATPLSDNRADCCVARAAYRVVLPVSESRPRPAELFFCGHHLRASLPGLRAAHAVVLDDHGAVVR